MSNTTLEHITQQFVDTWSVHGIQRIVGEKQQTQKFWNGLVRDVLGRPDLEKQAEPEYKTAANGFIDMLYPDARVLVEQKSSDVDLDKPEPRQGTMVTPAEQAKRYADALPPSLKPRYLCTCNFQTFRFYDLDEDPLATHKPFLEFPIDDLFASITNLTRIFGEHNSRTVVQQQLSE